MAIAKGGVVDVASSNMMALHEGSISAETAACAYLYLTPVDDQQTAACAYICISHL